MADYDTITLLSQLDETTPSGLEDASKLDDAVRQTRGFVKTFLAVSFNDAGTIKASAVGGGNIVDGSITAVKLAADAVETAKIKNLAVTTAKLDVDVVDGTKIADLAVDTEHLAADAVETAKIADLNVTTVKLADDAVSSAKLQDDASTDANRAVTTNHIRDSAVTDAKIAAVGIGKLSLSNNNIMLYRDGATFKEVQIGGAMSVSVDTGTTPHTLKFAFAGSGIGGAGDIVAAQVTQPFSSGTGGGSSSAATWNQRSGLSETQDPVGLISVGGAGITFAVAGTYQIFVRAMAYSVGRHRIKVRRTSGTPADLGYGLVAIAPPGVQNDALISLTFSAAVNDIIEIHHWTELALATYGLGAPANDGASEVYMSIDLVKI